MSREENTKKLSQFIAGFKYAAEELEAESGIETGFLVEALVNGLIKRTQEIVGPMYEVTAVKVKK